MKGEDEVPFEDRLKTLVVIAKKINVLLWHAYYNPDCGEGPR